MLLRPAIVTQMIINSDQYYAEKIMKLQHNKNAELHRGLIFHKHFVWTVFFKKDGYLKVAKIQTVLSKMILNDFCLF